MVETEWSIADGATRYAPVSCTSILALFVHNFSDKKKTLK